MGVPNLAGVPQLATYSAVASLASSLLTADSVILGLAPVQWGIFLGGAAVLPAQSVTSFGYKQEWAIADYNIEQGGFETYDKVQIPFDARFRLACGGGPGQRAALLSAIAAIAGDKSTLYTVVTPEQVYPSVTVSHYDYNREALKGVGLLQIDVWCFNVMVNTSNGFQSTAAPSGATPVPDGTVQPTTYPTIANDQTTGGSGVISPNNQPVFPGSP